MYVLNLQVAREALSELELPHLYRAVARGSPRRQELFKKRGLFQAPYLEVRLPGALVFVNVQVRVRGGGGQPWPAFFWMSMSKATCIRGAAHSSGFGSGSKLNES